MARIARSIRNYFARNNAEFQARNIADVDAALAELASLPAIIESASEL